MTKVIIRETIISLLVCLTVLLILSVALYNFIPSNKVIPEPVKYTPSAEIKTQLSTEVKDDSSEIIMTYEITASDLDNYERTNDYNPGKANPFAAVSTEPGNSDNGNSNGNPGGGNSNGGSSNNGSGGSIFENGSSK